MSEAGQEARVLEPWEEYERAVAEMERQQRLERSGLSPRDLRCTLDAFDPNLSGAEALRVARAFAEQYKPGDWVGLLFWGAPGVGKSHLCAGICLRLLERGISVYKVLTPEYVALSRSMFADEDEDWENLWRASGRARVLWLDDLTVDHISCSYDARRAAEALYRLLDRALHQSQALLITTNHPPEQLRDGLKALDGSTRIFDRLREMVWPVEVKGVSVRTHVRAQRAPEWLKAVVAESSGKESKRV